MDDTSWLRGTLTGATLIDNSGRICTLADVDGGGVTLTLASGDGRVRVATAEIGATLRLWSRLGRAPRPDELRAGGVAEATLPYAVPLVRLLRSVPQARDWAALPMVPTAGVQMETPLAG